MRVARDKVFLLLLGAGALVCFLLVTAAYVLHFGTALSAKHQQWGEFGEYLGGVLGPVFSLAAFIGVLWTIGLQVRAAEDARLQRIEDTFFHLLDRFARIRATPTYYTSAKDEDPPRVETLVLAREAWKAWIAMMNQNRDERPRLLEREPI